MSNKTIFKISSEDFNSHAGRELQQSILIGNREQSVFEFVLSSKVKRVISITPWSEKDGFFYSSVEFESNFVLDGIKRLTQVGSIFENCRLDVMMESQGKHGYYQYLDGNLVCGFSIRKDNAFYLKLVEDFEITDGVKDSFRVSLVQKLETPEYDFQKDQDTDEVKVYSFFGDENFDRERLLQAIKILGENRYPHISVSPDSVDPFPSSIDLSMHDFLKKSIVNPGSHIPDHCGGYVK